MEKKFFVRQLIAIMLIVVCIGCVLTVICQWISWRSTGFSASKGVIMAAENDQLTGSIDLSSMNVGDLLCIARSGDAVEIYQIDDLVFLEKCVKLSRSASTFVGERTLIDSRFPSYRNNAPSALIRLVGIFASKDDAEHYVKANNLINADGRIHHLGFSPMLKSILVPEER